MTKDPLAEIGWPEPAVPSARASKLIRESVTRDLKPDRGLSAGVRLLLSVAASAGVVFAALLLSGSSKRMEGALLGAVGWGIVQGAVLFLGLSRPPGRRVPRVARLVVLAVVIAAFFVYLGFAGSQLLPVGEFLGAEAHRHAAMGCAIQAVAWGALASGGVLLFWRRTDPLSPGVSGAIAGLAGGLAGAVAIGLACPSGETWHLWVGHGLVVVGLSLAGWFVGRKSFAP